jgi:hypothetical protein
VHVGEERGKREERRQRSVRSARPGSCGLSAGVSRSSAEEAATIVSLALRFVSSDGCAPVLLLFYFIVFFINLVFASLIICCWTSIKTKLHNKF